MAAIACDLSAAAILFGIEVAHIDRRLGPVATIEPLLAWALIMTATAVCATTVALLMRWRRPRVASPDLDRLHRVVLEEASAAAKAPLPGAVEATLKAACRALGTAIGGRVSSTLEEDHAPEYGLSENRGSWSRQVGPDRHSLTFTTTRTFDEQDVLLLERIAWLVDLLLSHAADRDAES